MSQIQEEIIPTTPEVEIEVPVVEEPVVLEEKRYEYQPTDEDGRPIGGKQVIKYHTNEELAEELAKQNTLLLRKLRKETRNNRLGIFEQEAIDESAPRLEKTFEFKKRVLTPEERFKLSQDILDPETFDKAVETVMEASIGTTGEQLASTITRLQQDNEAAKTQRETDKFLRDNRDYVVCPENSQAIVNWIARYGLAPVAANFQKAYNTLLEAGVLVTSLDVVRNDPPPPPPPPVVPEPVVETPVIETPVVETPVVETPVVEAPVVSRVPGALSRNNSSSAGVAPPPAGSDIVYEYVQRDASGRQVGPARVFTGLAAVEAMPSEEYKRRILKEPGFAKKVEKLEADALARKRRF